MDLHSNPQSELGKLEHIVSQFLLKSLHIILDSRIPSLCRNDHSGDLSLVSRVKKSDKWFNLILGDRPPALENLNFWHRNVMDPMIIDIILVHEGLNSSSVDNLYTGSTVGTPVETVIERWVVQYESPRVVAPQSGEISVSYKKTYQKSIVLLRALCSLMRLLPAHKIFKQLTSSSHTYNFDIIYKVSSFGDPFTRPEEKFMEEYSFTPVEAFPGRLCMSVTYHSSLSDFNLEPSTAMPPKIIKDYVGSPATDPMRSFPASDKGVRATSFPLRGVQSSSPVPAERPHSWTSGFHRPGPFVQNQTLFGSPPAYRPSPTSSDFPSSPNDMYPNRVHNRLLSYQKPISFDEYQLSPPFSSSPSPSPSPPTYFYNGNNPNSMQGRRHSETAPVSIPSTMTTRGSRYLSSNFSDPSRNSLPPLSPRSTRNDNSSQESPSGIRSLRRLDPSRAGETLTGNSNHFSGPKAIKDSRDDSGRFSGPLSSSGSPRVGFSPGSGRLSFQDDMDDIGFSCPFDVDDLPDFHHSQNLPGRKPFDPASQSLPMVRKSQSHDAAVGVLVHMLRNAPPLRQDSSCYSTNSFKAEPDGGITTASGFFVPRKAADALEELRSYREMKDLLLSKSGTRVVSKEEA